MALRQIASLNNGAVVLYEDVTLDRQGNVVERHGYTLDAKRAAAGDDVWFEARAADGRKMAEARTAKSEDAVRQLSAAADRQPDAVNGVTLSWERPQRTRATDVKGAVDGDRR